MNIKDVRKVIPHRYPFLLVDQILEIEQGKKAVGLKNVTANEWFFQGHFPDYPVMPGVLIVEALAQVGAVALLSLPENKGKIVLFAGIDNFRFKHEVLPGDQLVLSVEIQRRRGNIGKGSARAEVNNKVVAEGELLFAIK